MNPTSRRRLLLGASALAAAASTGALAWRWQSQPQSRVMLRKASGYELDLATILLEGIREYPEVVRRARGARVVLKPNLVEYSAARPINTDPRVVRAAAEAFRRLDAKEVVVAEGPGHRRDTELIVEQSGLKTILDEDRLPFVDLNIDDTRSTPLVPNKTGLGKLELPRTVVGADLLVSVAKMKVHHWAGATLTMKNLFGVVPGAVYGWPKNPLHWGGIDKSILDLWATLRPAFGIVDGIVGMEGDGPIMGTPVDMGVLAMGDNLPALDATCARLMGLEPGKMAYIDQSVWHGGALSEGKIERIGDEIARRDFAILPHLAHLRA